VGANPGEPRPGGRKAAVVAPRDGTVKSQMASRCEVKATEGTKKTGRRGVNEERRRGGGRRKPQKQNK
jgi:hypothetical protein